MPNMTGRPGYRTMEMNGGSSAPYLACAPCVPLFCALFYRGGNRRAFRLPGAGGDHFHCTVEPSPGHIRCRKRGIRVGLAVRCLSAPPDWQPYCHTNQMRHPSPWPLVEGRPNSLASTLSALAVAATSYCHPGHPANVVTPCLLSPCLLYHQHQNFCNTKNKSCE